MKKSLVLFTLILSLAAISKAQLPPVFSSSRAAEAQNEPTTRRLLSLVRIVWKSADSATNIINAKRLLKRGNGQADLSGKDLCILNSNEKGKPGLLLDFGNELHGGLQLVTDQSKRGKPVRVHHGLGPS